MSFTTLKPEIWMHILEFLRPPLPKPLSGLTKQEAFNEPIEVTQQLPDENEAGVTRRADIRSDALAKLMRTSLTFNQLASFPLYRRVITDDYSTLTSHGDHRPTHPSIRSKVELLGLTRRLHLEYKPKARNPLSTIPEPPYLELMTTTSSWAVLGPSRAEAAVVESIAELYELDQALGGITGPSKFVSLTHLTLGMVFGGQDKCWEDLMDLEMAEVGENPEGPDGVPRELELADSIEWCNRGLLSAFRGAPLISVCQRGRAGPICLPRTSFSWTSERSGRPSSDTTLFTFHNNINFHPRISSDFMAAAVGHPTCWILESALPPKKAGACLITTSASVARLVTDLDENRAGTLAEVAVDLRIYGVMCGLPFPTPRRHEADSTETHPSNSRELDAIPGVSSISILSACNQRFENKLKASERPTAKLDRIRCLPTAEVPPCGACSLVYTSARTVQVEGEDVQAVSISVDLE